MSLRKRQSGRTSKFGLRPATWEPHHSREVEHQFGIKVKDMAGNHSLNGIHFMLPTPFSGDGGVDDKPFPRLLEAARAAGCRGVVCLGVMGEAHRLTDAERSRVIEAVVADSGDLTVTVGISSDSERVVSERAREAETAGATAVMASPARLAKPNPVSTFNYYACIQESTAIPIVVQDLPEQTGVHMDPAFIARLNSELPGARYLKLEDPADTAQDKPGPGPDRGPHGRIRRYGRSIPFRRTPTRGRWDDDRLRVS